MGLPPVGQACGWLGMSRCLSREGKGQLRGMGGAGSQGCWALSFEAGEGDPGGGQVRQKPGAGVRGGLQATSLTAFLPCPLQVAKLKARLTLMDEWLQGSNCGPWGPLDILQGEAPRGDIYQGHHLLHGTEPESRGWLVRALSLHGLQPGPVRCFEGSEEPVLSSCGPVRRCPQPTRHCVDVSLHPHIVSLVQTGAGLMHPSTWQVKAPGAVPGAGRVQSPAPDSGPSPTAVPTHAPPTVLGTEKISE